MVSNAYVVSSGAGARLSLALRAGLIALLLVAEKFVLNFFVDFDAAQRAVGFGALVRVGQHLGFRFIAALVISLALLTYAAADVRWVRINAAVRGIPVRLGWLALHLVLLLPLAAISSGLYGARGPSLPLPVLTGLWLLCGLLAVIALLRAMAPWRIWSEAVRALGMLWVYAAAAALVAASIMQWNQELWGSTAAVTFDAVRYVLAPIIPHLQSDPARRVLASDRFAIQVADVCSGLEGIGLLLAFCCAWLLCFRKEYIFPRALVLIPLGLALSFGLNVLRIAALMLIGHEGFPDVAVYGFHSQAGWIAFNCAAGGIAIASRRSAWLNRTAAAAAAAASAAAHAHGTAETPSENPTAVYLLPFLAALGAGMIVHAVSAGFPTWYGAQVLVALVALAWSAPRLARLSWRCSWRGPLAGALVFALWIGAATVWTKPSGMPEPLAAMSAGTRELWIAVRALGAVVTVPIIEELAYRGFLMRRLVSADFEAVDFRRVGTVALLLTSLAFGLMHGSLWLAGICAGIVYGALAIRTGRLGEAVAAHATTNALLAAYVLAAGQWQLW